LMVRLVRTLSHSLMSDDEKLSAMPR